MMRRKSNKNVWKKGIVLVLILIFSILLINAHADEEPTRISELEKEELSDEDNENLKEYYSKVFDIVGPDTKFNNIATKENIAILNVTIDGRDRRILTKLATGIILPKITDALFAARLQANNLTVLDNLRIIGKNIFSTLTSFGQREFYGIAGSEAKYVDEGFSRLYNGKANVSINPVLRELISGYNVYLSAEGLTQGIYVAEKSSSYFIVKSVNSGSNIGFSWMLSGVKKEFEGKLKSVYGEQQGIGIFAIVNAENGTTAITINGFDKILALINQNYNQTINNANITNDNITNEAQNNAQSNNDETNNNGRGIQLITGNLVDEFGLETDLGKILSNASTLPAGISGQSAVSDDKQIQIKDDTTINEPYESNETIEIVSSGFEELAPSGPDFEFTLFSIDEDFIVAQVSIVTGLSLEDARMLISFVYAEPTGFKDEPIEPENAQLGFIEKINGSVIIRLG